LKSFSFNGITKAYLTVLRGSNRQPWAPVEWTYQDIPNLGSIPIKKKLKNKPFPIPVLLKAESIQNLQKIKEDFANWLIQDEPKPLICDDEPDRTYYAWVDGSFDPNEIVDLGKGTIPFIVKPYKEGSEKIASVTGSVNVEGTTLTDPIFIVNFTAAASEFKITHQETSGFVRVIWNFVAGDKLEIDLSKRKAIINGIVNMTAYYWRNKPFKLVPGVNTFVIEPAGATDVQIKFRPRWK
jgi:predicted phage tail component-like protein